MAILTKTFIKAPFPNQLASVYKTRANKPEKVRFDKGLGQYSHVRT